MTEGNSTVCPPSDMILLSGLWADEIDIEVLSEFLFPVLIMQTSVILALTRFLAYALKPFGQPRVVAELIGGILLGPAVFGKLTYSSASAENAGSPQTSVVKSLYRFLFPPTSYTLIEAIGFLGLIYYVFLVAVELDVKVFRVMGRKVVAIAMASLTLPLLATAATVAVFGLPAPMANNSYKGSGTEQAAFVLLLSFALSITAFPILARLLAELKIPNPELGQVVLPSALVGDVVSWLLLALCFAVIGPGDKAAAHFNNEYLAPFWMVLAAACLVLLCLYVVRPFLEWTVRQMPEGEPVNNVYMGLVLIFVLGAALASATIGFHPVFGALVLGLAVPKGPLTTALIERLDDFVIGFMLPFLIVGSGLKVDVASLIRPEGNEPPHYVFWLGCIVVVATLAKVAGCMIVSSFYSMPRSQGLSLGILMNTMGPAQAIILNMGKSEKVFNQKIHALLVVTSVISTALVSPLVTALDRKCRGPAIYKQRNLELSRRESDLRLVACVHTVRNVPSVISLLQLSNPTYDSPLLVSAVHLVELTGRTPPMLIVHEAGANGTLTRRNSDNTPPDLVHSEPIVSAFEKYQQHAGCVTLQSLTAVSAYSSMHEDICNIAADHHATLIVLPFHKLLTVDGEMEVINPAIRAVNQGVLTNAPCSVGILVDRGLGEHGKFANAGHQTPLHVAILFFGGPDDREALMYGRRFLDQPGVVLTVVRFLPSYDAEAPAAAPAVWPAKVDRLWDDECIREFRLQYGDNASVSYTDKVVSNSSDTVVTIRSMGSIYDFYVVGRASGGDSPLIAGMREFTDFPELGPIGDLLVSSDMDAMASVLVMQQYVEERMG
ncbi:hypothetical protein OPV22_031619 [Ensete ventricosum]|uniref:Cation/H+ exchanger domain-containing protein n=1 Tax=Ensete ventricosum TaxID=4639 RepID=A0AAV8PPI8_ENSVE|nr:hypothetical protein OPV22_031619 [Ensete ventricosum]